MFLVLDAPLSPNVAERVKNTYSRVSGFPQKPATNPPAPAPNSVQFKIHPLVVVATNNETAALSSLDLKYTTHNKRLAETGNVVPLPPVAPQYVTEECLDAKMSALEENISKTLAHQMAALFEVC